MGDESNEDEMHGACGINGGLKKMYTKVTCRTYA